MIRAARRPMLIPTETPAMKERRLSRTTCWLVLASLLVLTGAPRAAASRLEPHKSSSESDATAARGDDEDDPDLPALLRGKISKRDYLRQRDRYMARLRGLPDRDAGALRQRALREME